MAFHHIESEQRPQSTRLLGRRELLKAIIMLGGLVLVSCFVPSCLRRTEQRERRPNIVLFYDDEHRQSALGCYGHPTLHTPNIDALASRGALFSRMYCQGPVCMPSRASLVTGLYVHDHGTDFNIAAQPHPELPTFMQRLQAAGYVTAEVGKMHFYGRPPGGRDLRKSEDFIKSYGFDYALECHDRYIDDPGVFPGLTSHYGVYIKERGLEEANQKDLERLKLMSPNMWAGVTSEVPAEHDIDSFVAWRAIDWLRNYDGKKPFFLWASFVGPHPPFCAPKEYADMYSLEDVVLGPRELPKASNEVWGHQIERMAQESANPLLTDDFVRRTGRQYYGKITLIDDRIGDIMKVIEEKGWSDNTWFIFNSDHGEMMGDHGFMTKWNFYKSSVLVPCIICPPSGIKPRVIDNPVESIDLTATLLDISGAQPLEGSSGRSLLPFLEGTAKPKKAVFSEISNRTHDAFFVMVATDRYRYTYEAKTGTPCEFFDLKEDPDELNNLVNDSSMQSLMKELYRDYLRPFLAGKELGE